MCPSLLLQVSPVDRVTAVHEHFSTRSWSDAGTVIFVALMLAIGLSAMLLILNRAQKRHQAADEREHIKRLEQLTKPKTTARLQRRLPTRALPPYGSSRSSHR